MVKKPKKPTKQLRKGAKLEPTKPLVRKAGGSPL